MNKMLYKLAERHRDFGSMPFLTTTQPNEEVCIMANPSIPRKMNICKIAGCGRDSYRMGICGLHYSRYYQGVSLTARTIYDPNEIVLERDHARIFLYDKNGNKVAEAIIDLDDVQRVSQWKWHLHSKGYVESRGRKHHFFLHRFINNTPDGILTDHKNMNKLNNRKFNLRDATPSESQSNRGKQNNNSGSFKGVTKQNKSKYWQATVTYAGKMVCVGHFKTEIEAAIAYNEMAKRLHGDFANLNSIGD